MAATHLAPPPWLRALRVLEVELRRYRRTWRASVFSAFVNPLLFLGAMGYGLGELVAEGQGTATLPDGVSYVAFIAPGLMVAAAMQTGAAEGAFPVMAGVKWQRTYHATIATPATVTDLVVGNTLWLSFRVAVTAGVYGLVVAVLGAMSPVAAAASVGPALLVGWGMGLPMTAIAAHVDQPSTLSAFFRFGVLPLFLLSGTFFPVSELPAAAEVVAALTPVWHGVELARAAALGTAPPWPVLGHLAVPTLWGVTGFVAARRTLARRLAP